MLPAQACAKWPPYLPVRVHDGTRRILNIPTPFYRGCFSKLLTMWYFIRKPCCVHLLDSKLRWKAQRSHVTCICASILLTFSSVKASGDRPRTWCTFREQMPGGDSEPRPGLTARCCVLTASALPCVLHLASAARRKKEPFPFRHLFPDQEYRPGDTIEE